MNEVDSVLKLFLHVETFLTFLFIIVPGFISLRAYESRSGAPHQAVNESLVDIIVYSFAADIIWIPIFKAASSFPSDAGRTLALVGCGIGLISTAIVIGRGWYSLQIYLAKSGTVIDPTPKPWDKFFKTLGSRQIGIVLTLPDGRKLGGRFAPGFASSHPADEQIHVGEAWEIDQDTGIFLKRVEGSLGFLIDKKDVLTLEFFDWIIIDRAVEEAALEAGRGEERRPNEE